jgi:LPS sulfotransferase NodH
MPAFRKHSVLEITRGVKAFFTLAAGITRGEVPDPVTLQDRLQVQTQKLVQAQRRVEKLRQQMQSLQRSAPVNTEQTVSPERNASADTSAGINPQNMVWILGSPRTGSTWLSEILADPKGCALWREPFFGVVLNFRDNLAHRGYINSKQFLLGESYRDVWVGSMRRLFLDVGRAKFPNIAPRHHLIIKEPNGSMSAPLILEAFPESKLVFLVRDSRDVVASLLDAAQKGSWYGYDKFEASVAEAVRRGGGPASPLDRSDDELVGQLARNYVTNVSAVKEAYARHPEGAKVMIRYEDLRAAPQDCVSYICDSLGIEVDSEQLKQDVERRAFERIPQEHRGRGKFHRKATPGGWREDLTPEQVRVVEEITGPLLREFYPDSLH